MSFGEREQMCIPLIVTKILVSFLEGYILLRECPLREGHLFCSTSVLMTILGRITSGESGCYIVNRLRLALLLTTIHTVKVI